MIYCEILYPEGYRYYCLSDHSFNNLIDEMAFVNRADRVWAETNEGIEYIKLRHGGNPGTTPVNMEEFFWIKLKAITV